MRQFKENYRPDSAPDSSALATADPRWKVAVTGASGLIGSELVRALRANGHRVLRLVRTPPAASGEVFWDPADGRIDAAKLEGIDAVIHLAGENVGKRWSRAQKRRIRESRTRGTQLLSRTLAGLSSPPAVLVSASAVGIYGSRGEERLDEDSAPGEGFLAEVVQEWEASAEPARDAGIRVVHPRLGVVMSRGGGVLQRLLLPFRLGLGGRAGSGEQWMSWISLADAVDAIRFAMGAEGISGAMNVTAPGAVTNAEFAEVFGRVLRRPTLLPVPAGVLRLGLGTEMASETLLASQRVVPRVLLVNGFHFQHPEIESALRAALRAP
ncbi:MAG: TIGR01777 family oxidoreductase [Gemmatimonadota bacterium]|nr:TIGR01777 family oxidoreductase [Gemmatimonadota bacterium]